MERKMKATLSGRAYVLSWLLGNEGIESGDHYISCGVVYVGFRVQGLTEGTERT